MPATHLITVDLPAPWSPTSAITSPSRTSKSTPRSACTDPKLFCTPCSSSVTFAGVVAIARRLYHGRGAREAPRPCERRLAAVLRVLAGADVALFQGSVVEEERVVLLRDPYRFQQDRFGARDGL